MPPCILGHQWISLNICQLFCWWMSREKEASPDWERDKGSGVFCCCWDALQNHSWFLPKTAMICPCCKIMQQIMTCNGSAISAMGRPLVGMWNLWPLVPTTLEHLIESHHLCILTELWQQILWIFFCRPSMRLDHKQPAHIVKSCKNHYIWQIIEQISSQS